MLVTGENRTEVPSSPSPLEEDTPRPESPTEVPTELPSPSKSPRPADNDEEGGSFFILKGPRIDPEKGYRVDVNEDRDDSPDVESSSVSSASSWNSTDEQMRKTLMKSEMVPVMLTIGSSSGRRTNARGSCWEGTSGDKPTWLSMGHQLARFGAVDESMVQWIYEPTYNLVMNH